MNRVALVVGVGPGLGAALGRRLARGGFRVALIARGPDFINELARELHSLGQPALPIVTPRRSILFGCFSYEIRPPFDLHNIGVRARWFIPGRPRILAALARRRNKVLPPALA